MVGFFSLIFLSTCFEKRISFNRKLTEWNPRRAALNERKSWKYIEFNEAPNYNEIRKLGIPIDSTNFISKLLYRMYLSDGQTKILNNNFNTQIFETAPNDKFFESLEGEVTPGHIIIEAGEDFMNTIKLPFVNTTRLSNNFYDVSVNNIAETSSKLSKLDSVNSIFRPPKFVLENRYSVGRSQGGPDPQLSADKVFESARVMEKRGLTGEGEVIEIEDTGIDQKSTYFYDKNVQVQYDRIMNNHRKFVYYSTRYGNTIDESGHGTHVAGIAAGKANCDKCTDALYNGNAPDAKIAFIDRMSYSDMQSVELDHKVDIAKKTGAHIFSQSIGIDPRGKQEFNLKFALEHADILGHTLPETCVFYSAGNYGPAPTTVGSLAAGKNNLAVANRLTRFAVSFEGLDDKPPIFPLYKAELVISGTKEFNDVRWCNFSRSPMLSMNPIIEGDSVAADAPDIAGKIVIIKSDACNTLSGLASKSPLAAYVVADPDQLVCGSVDFPVFASTADASEMPYVTPAVNPKINSGIYLSSSQGPDVFGRRKPDIAAVGSLVMSAKAEAKGQNDHSSRIGYLGTSMATPNAAGAGALVSQFFRKFRGKEANGPLIRAAMVASAQPIPNHNRSVQGYGEIKLSNVLRFDPDVGLQVAYNESIRVNQTVQATVRASGKESLTVVMAYNDPSLDYLSYYILAADLSLTVESPSGKVFWGNGAQEMASTVERVVIQKEDVEQGDYKIVVSAVGLDIQSFFSVVAIGTDSNADLSFTNPGTCQAGCSGHGTCNRGHCVCKDGFFGVGCQEEEIELQQFGYIQLKGEETKFFRFSCSNCRRAQLILYGNQGNYFVYAGTGGEQTLTDYPYMRKFTEDYDFESLACPDCIIKEVPDVLHVAIYNAFSQNVRFRHSISVERNPNTPTPDETPAKTPTEDEKSSAEIEKPDKTPSEEKTHSDQMTPSEEKSSSDQIQSSEDKTSSDGKPNDDQHNNEEVKSFTESTGFIVLIIVIAACIIIAAISAVIIVLKHNRTNRVQDASSIEIPAIAEDSDDIFNDPEV